ncbi:MAG TPA: tetraacyldisaccharide 4'-kinase [Desulfobacteraceae bacterium]|nr:tetraacyldisaccharide 4'-kinase [Desulfobacteraceae bacterium]
MKKPIWTELHRKDSHGFWTPLLAAASAAYGLGLSLCPSPSVKRLPGFVLSVGNIVAGGSGKTPAVIMLARWAKQCGHRTAVLSRGYRGSFRGRVLEVSGERSVNPEADRGGDEPWLIAESISGVPVIVARKRYDAGVYARRKFGSTFFVLDDGFQHRELARDFDLVLMDAVEPWGNGHLLPRGPLREPIASLERADAVVLTRSGRGDNGAAVKHVLRSRGLTMPVFLAEHSPDCIVGPGGENISSDRLNGLKVVAFSGIGAPASFMRSLEGLGAEVAHFEAFPDHHPFTSRELGGLEKIRRRTGAEWLVTTEKDWMRIRASGMRCPVSIRFLRIAFSLLPGSEGLLKMISERIGDGLQG